MADLNVTNFSVAPPGSFPATVERKTDPAGGVTPTFVQWGAITGNILNQIDLQQALALKAGVAELNAHIADHANPHAVTKAQVGLGNVENLSPAELAVAIQPIINPLVTITASQITDSSANGRTVLTGTASQGRTALGANASGSTIFTGATANGATIATGATAPGVAIATAATAAAQRTALGSGSIGDAIFQSSTFITTSQGGTGINLASTPLPVAQGGTGDAGTQWSTQTVTPVSSTGALTSASAVWRFKVIGKTAFFNLNVSITTNGTAGTNIVVPMPTGWTAKTTSGFGGRETAVTGLSINAQVLAAGTDLVLVRYDGTYLGGNGYNLSLCGVIELT